ncbi:MAG: Arylsulfatase [Chloroflexi bacterium OLB14]|nr:MAG: Arylsulfatase [Chloroflexi bacterium OLB14]
MLNKIKNLIMFIMGIFLLTACQALPRFNDQRPNFLIIITDDQRYDTMQYMPNTQELIFNQGVTFNKGYVTTPFCCPSRASILTGMYAHNTWVHKNEDTLEFRTMVEDIKKNGYYTGLIGKYLNSWKGETRYEYDFWVSIWGGTIKNYYDPDLDVNGTWSKHTGYVTYLFRDYAIQFLDEASAQSKPFLLIFTPNAPHAPFTPAKEDVNSYTDLPPHRPTNFNEVDISDKPLSIANQALLTEEDIQGIETTRRRQILTLTSLDRTIPDIINKLEEIGELDNTVIIFISDNGKHWGEHRLTSKSTAYEESVKVPFALRYPDLVPVPYIDDSHLVANIDIAPTLYELSETKMPDTVDGLSLVGLLNGTADWRDMLLLEAWPDRGHWSAVHTGDMIYIETENDLSEFYDLTIDPFQMDNMINNAKYQEIIAQLKQYLEQERIPTTTQP